MLVAGRWGQGYLTSASVASLLAHSYVQRAFLIGFNNSHRAEQWSVQHSASLFYRPITSTCFSSVSNILPVSTGWMRFRLKAAKDVKELMQVR